MKRSVLIILPLLLMVTAGGVWAQPSSRRQELSGGHPTHNVYGELVVLSMVSLNYEYVPDEHLSLRAGLATYTPHFAGNGDLLGATLMGNLLLGGEDFKFMLGAGAVLPLGRGRVIGTGALGIRHQPHDGGFFWSLAWRPVFLNGYDDGVLATIFGLTGIGVGIGHSF